MKNTNIWIAYSVLALALAGCGDSGGTGGDDATTATTGASVTSTKAATVSQSVSVNATTVVGSSSTGNMNFPPAPDLGAVQLDRMGRAAVNTALNETFVKTIGGIGASENIAREMAEDDYNATKDATLWDTKFKATAAVQLAILDGLDGTCGNQPLACTNGSPNAMCYGGLAGVLVNDRLWATTNYTSCQSYLGVEVKVLNPAAPVDCGGRRPADDVIATTYTVLSGATSTFDDGITAPNGLHPDTFPYFAPVN